MLPGSLKLADKDTISLILNGKGCLISKNTGTHHCFDESQISEKTLKIKKYDEPLIASWNRITTGSKALDKAIVGAWAVGTQIAGKSQEGMILFRLMQSFYVIKRLRYLSVKFGDDLSAFLENTQKYQDNSEVLSPIDYSRPKSIHRNKVTEKIPKFSIFALFEIFLFGFLFISRRLMNVIFGCIGNAYRLRHILRGYYVITYYTMRLELILFVMIISDNFFQVSTVLNLSLSGARSILPFYSIFSVFTALLIIAYAIELIGETTKICKI